MTFILSDDQRQVTDTARRFFGARAPTSLLRRLRDEQSPLRFDPAVWQEMGEVGLPATALPEIHGGIGLGFSTLGRVLIEAGRTLAPSPLFATSVLGASVIELAGTSEQRDLYLPLVAEGALTLCLAHEEGAAHDPDLVATRVEGRGDRRLSGRKRFVFDGDIAHKIIVLARTAGTDRDHEGVSFFLVDREAPGVTSSSLSMVDSRSIADIDFENVAVTGADLIGGEGQAHLVFDKVMDRARASISAETLGMALELCQRRHKMGPTTGLKTGQLVQTKSLGLRLGIISCGEAAVA